MASRLNFGIFGQEVWVVTLFSFQGRFVRSIVGRSPSVSIALVILSNVRSVLALESINLWAVALQGLRQ